LRAEKTSKVEQEMVRWQKNAELNSLESESSLVHFANYDNFYYGKRFLKKIFNLHRNLNFFRVFFKI